MTPEQLREELARAYHALQQIENLAAEEPELDFTDDMFKIANRTLKILDLNGVYDEIKASA